MRTTASIVADVLAWVGVTLPEVQSLSDWPVQENPRAYPDVAAEVRGISEALTPPGNAPTTAHARGVPRTIDLALSILVEPLPAREAAHSLWSMADRLIEARRVDRTLGHGLHSTQITTTVPGLVTLSDGSAVMALVVALTVTVSP
jgi:hypothetical protein